MTLATLERAIFAEAREVSGNKKLRLKDMQEWSSGTIEPHENEVIYKLPKLGVNASFLKAAEKEAKE